MRISKLFIASFLILLFGITGLSVCQAQNIAHANLGKIVENNQLIEATNITITSIYADAEGASVYSLQINQEIPEKVSIHFKDVTGSMSITHTFSNLPKGFEYPLYLTGFPPGIYSLEIITNGQTIRKQIQKKR